MIKDILINLIKEVIFDLGLEIETKDIFLEHPFNLSNGDYSTNIAMIFAKKIDKKPKELAKEIVDKIINKLSKNQIKEIEKVEIAEPGFINFFLSKDFFSKNLKEILEKKEKWGNNNLLNNQKIIIEYTDPNPFKEFHIGHLMSNTIGESISRILEFSGGEVKRANYQGDVGLHIAKAVWGFQQLQQRLSLLDVKLLGEVYAQGAKAYENDEKAKNEIKEINKKIYDKSDTAINAIYDRGRAISLEYFEKIYKKLGTKFDYYFFESQTFQTGKKLIKENIGKVFEESDGAVVFRGENVGLHTRVFINSEGLPTYEAKDLALAKTKKDKYDYEKSIIVTANEQKEYYKVVLASMRKIFPDLAGKTKHITHGMMRLSSGKMSSRTGDVVTGELFIGEVEKRVFDKMKDSDIVSKEETAEQVAVGSIKYSILKQSTGKDIIYDIEKSLSFEGDSGPYLQYSFVRANAVLEKAKVENVASDLSKVGHQIRATRLAVLERLLYRFPEIIKRASLEFEPHYIITYLTELAGAFNSFYANEKIVEENDASSSYKVALTEAFKTTLKNGLCLLGIKTPYRM